MVDWFKTSSKIAKEKWSNFSVPGSTVCTSFSYTPAGTLQPYTNINVALLSELQKTDQENQQTGTGRTDL